MELDALSTQSYDLYNTTKLESPTADGGIKKGKTKEAASNFAAIFVNQMLQSAEKTKLCEDKLFNSDQQKIMKSLYNQEISKKLTHSGSFGIAHLIQTQLSQKV